MSAVLGTAESVPQAADLSYDEVDESVDQLIKNLQMFVLFEAAQTLSAETAQRRKDVLNMQKKTDLSNKMNKKISQKTK